jgi:protein-S-isoprenylcysteine O-methyltransferase Ste14
MMTATESEFRYRFWIIGAIFGSAFSIFSVDHVPFAAFVAGTLHVQERIVLVVAALLVAFAAALRTWAAAWLASDVVHDQKLHADRLVADGPYRRLRNPLYLGTLLLGVGFGMLASRSGWLFITLALGVEIQRLIRREESALLAAQGDTYRAYHASVPSLVPALFPRLPSSGRSPQWRQAFGGEAFMWGFAATAAAYAATRRWDIAAVLLVVAFVARFAARAVETR